MAEQKTHPMNRIEGAEHRRILRHVPSARGRERDKPNQSEGSEKCRDPRRSMRLHREQAEKDQHRQRNNIRFKRRFATSRPSTADNTESAGVIMRVAVKKGGADHAKHDHREAAASTRRTLGERHQGECSTFAVIVGTQQNDHVLDANNRG